MNVYKSTPMQCNVADDNCCVCRFLNGGREYSDMLEVIRLLDDRLNREEKLSRWLLSSLLKKLDAASRDGEPPVL